ncbi:hypothetical protein CDAR_40391 [Caerostris darwini]|uniref:Uncharacterized protein n=1 Tax=Caerostris darwini TaxID=1538125 RepID=A0AAV4R8D2_9ARAC|nr:hypothetical protein CDAR_40391 [Caerostris darwini]
MELGPVIDKRERFLRPTSSKSPGRDVGNGRSIRSGHSGQLLTSSDPLDGWWTTRQIHLKDAPPSTPKPFVHSLSIPLSLADEYIHREKTDLINVAVAYIRNWNIRTVVGVWHPVRRHAPPGEKAHEASSLCQQKTGKKNTKKRCGWSLTCVVVRRLLIAAGRPVGPPAADGPRESRSELARPQEREKGVHIDGVHPRPSLGSAVRHFDCGGRPASAQWHGRKRERETHRRKPS